MNQRISIILILWLLIAAYFFSALQSLSHNPFIYLIYWLVDGILVLAILYSIFFNKPKIIGTLLSPMLLLLIPRIFGSIILLIEDITRLFRGFPNRNLAVSQLTVVLAGTIFLLLLFGITRGRHYYKVRKQTLYFDDLPAAFDGFTITQLSDIHAGSFTNKKGVQKGIDLVNAQQSDLILFTGDLVNNKAKEMEPWISIFAQLNATYGKYAVLGNHDYGDYIAWEHKQAKQDNFNRLKQIHQEMGFHLLLNDHKKIEKSGESIALIGVENWGKGSFHKYGDLKKASLHVTAEAFKILMSHDPSHWDAEVNKHHQPIHLTLAGHTHGMQFGFEIFGFKWSPIKYVYKQWAGLYQHKKNYLYVNRGFGYLGLKGRIGMWPEIAIITLKRK